MVARSTANDLSSALIQVLEGEPHQLRTLQTADHSALLAAATSLRVPLLVTRMALASVLRGLEGRAVSPEEAQRWASFVRRGYFGRSGGDPIQPLDIAYEEESEDAIVEVVARLDEIGDAVDGEVSPKEIRELLQLLADS
jgi:hypothetical protein